MKFLRQKEIDAIISECKDFEELNRLTRLQAIYFDEITRISQSIFIVGAKVDKLRKD